MQVASGTALLKPQPWAGHSHSHWLHCPCHSQAEYPYNSELQPQWDGYPSHYCWSCSWCYPATLTDAGCPAKLPQPLLMELGSWCCHIDWCWLPLPQPLPQWDAATVRWLPQPLLLELQMVLPSYSHSLLNHCCWSCPPPAPGGGRRGRGRGCCWRYGRCRGRCLSILYIASDAWWPGTVIQHGYSLQGSPTQEWIHQNGTVSQKRA